MSKDKTTLMERMLKASTVKQTAQLDESILFKDSFVAPTVIPMFNVALGGNFGAGLTSGVTQFAGPSKHFKTLFGMVCAKAYLTKFPDAVIMFYDSEFGAGWKYFESMGIDRKRVIHTPVENLEILKHDLVAQLQEIKRGDHVFIFVDSVGNLASLKEVEDAEKGKSVTDMTRAKAMKSLFRIVTPMLSLRDIPMVAVNHSYKTLELYSKDVVSGGTGAYYSSQQIFIIGRQQEKGKGDEDKKVIGYNFILNVDKSRTVPEKSKIAINVTFDEGINTWSGLLEVALDGGFVMKPKNGVYSPKGSRKEYSEAETNSKVFWGPLLANEEFCEYVKSRFTLSSNNLLNGELTQEEVDGEYEAAKNVKTAVESTSTPKKSLARAIAVQAEDDAKAQRKRRRDQRKAKG